MRNIFQTDSNNKLIMPTFVLCHAYQEPIDTLSYVEDFDFEFVENGVDEIGFSLARIHDGKPYEMFDLLKDFQVIYIPEWEKHYQIQVAYKDGAEETVKIVTGKFLCKAELSQLILNNIEINTEADIVRDAYAVTTIYDEEYPNMSLLNRILKDKAPHYSVKYVSPSLCGLVRSFSIDGQSIDDFLTTTLAEEINCVVEYDSMDKSISLYDVLKVCSDCGYRGDYLEDVCPECGSKNVSTEYGQDMGIIISTKNIAEEITVETDMDSVKTCFNITGGDDMMNAALRAINPNGTSYIYGFSNDIMSDMPETLRERIKSYNSLYASLQPGYKEIMKQIFDLYDEISYYEYEMTGIPEVNTTAQDELNKLKGSTLGNIGIAYLNDTTGKSVVDNAVLGIARLHLSNGYSVKIDSSTFTYSSSGSTWSGKFTVYHYSDEEDTATSPSDITLTVTNDYETYVQQKLDKALANKDAFDIDTDWTKYSLEHLKNYESAYNSCLEALIQSGMNDTDTNGQICKDLYSQYFTELKEIQSEMLVRESTISELNTRLSNLESQQHLIVKQLDFQSYLGEELYKIFCCYRRDENYNNPNYISDGLNNADLLRKAEELLETASIQLYKASQTKYTIGGTIANFLLMKEFEEFRDECKLGNWIYVQTENDDVYKLRLNGLSGSYDSLEKLQPTFSNAYKSSEPIDMLKDTILKANGMASSYKYVSHQASSGNMASQTLADMMKNGLNASHYRIMNADNQDVVIDEHGILCRELDELTGAYNPEQAKFISNLLCYTDDGWETVKQAIGKITYTDPELNTTVNKYGVIADTIIAADIYGSKFVGGDIYSDNYWETDSKGSHINLNDGTFSLAGGAINFDGTDLNVKMDNLASEINMVADEIVLTGRTTFENGDSVQDLISDASSSASSASNKIDEYKEACKNGTTVINGGCIETGTLDADAISADFFTTASQGSGWTICKHPNPEVTDAAYIFGNNGTENNVVLKTGGDVAFACGFEGEYNPGDSTGTAGAKASIQIYHNGQIRCEDIRPITSKDELDITATNLTVGGKNDETEAGYVLSGCLKDIDVNGFEEQLESILPNIKHVTQKDNNYYLNETSEYPMNYITGNVVDEGFQKVVAAAIRANYGIDNVVIFKDSNGNYITPIEESYNGNSGYSTSGLINNSWTVRLLTTYGNSIPTMVTPNWWLADAFQYNAYSDSFTESFYCANAGGTSIDFNGYGWTIVYSSKPIIAFNDVPNYANGSVYYEYTLKYNSLEVNYDYKIETSDQKIIDIVSEIGTEIIIEGDVLLSDTSTSYLKNYSVSPDDLDSINDLVPIDDVKWKTLLLPKIEFEEAKPYQTATITMNSYGNDNGAKFVLDKDNLSLYNNNELVMESSDEGNFFYGELSSGYGAIDNIKSESIIADSITIGRSDADGYILGGCLKGIDENGFGEQLETILPNVTHVTQKDSHYYLNETSEYPIEASFATVDTVNGCYTTDGTWYPDLWNEVDWGEYSESKDAVKSRNSKVIVTYDGWCYEYNFVPANASSFQGSNLNGCPAYYIDVYDWIRVVDGVVTNVSLATSNRKPAFYWASPNGTYVEIIGSNFDYRCSGVENLPYSNMTYIDIPDLWNEVDWGSYAGYKEAIKNRNSNFIVSKSGETYIYFFTQDLPIATTGMSIQSKPAYYIQTQDYLYLKDNTLSYCEPNCNKLMSFWCTQGDGTYVDVLGSTYDYRCGGLEDFPHSNLEYAPEPTPTTDSIAVNYDYIIEVDGQKIISVTSEVGQENIYSDGELLGTVSTSYTQDDAINAEGTTLLSKISNIISWEILELPTIINDEPLESVELKMLTYGNDVGAKLVLDGNNLYIYNNDSLIIGSTSSGNIFYGKATSSRIYINSTAPTDTDLLWVDNTSQSIKAYIDGAWTNVS